MKKAKGLIALVLIFALSACAAASGKTSHAANPEQTASGTAIQATNSEQATAEDSSQTELLPHAVLSQMEIIKGQKKWVLSVPQRVFNGDMLSLVLTYGPSEKKQDQDSAAQTAPNDSGQVDKEMKNDETAKGKNQKNKKKKEIKRDTIIKPLTRRWENDIQAQNESDSISKKITVILTLRKVEKNQDKEKEPTYSCYEIRKKNNSYYAYVLDTIGEMQIEDAKLYLGSVEDNQKNNNELQLDLGGEMPFEPGDFSHPIKIWIVVVVIAIVAVIVILVSVLLHKRKKPTSGETDYELRIYHEERNEKNICVFRLTDESEIDLWSTMDANGNELTKYIKKTSSGLPALSAKLDKHARAVTIRYKQNDKTICVALNDDHRVIVIKGPEGKDDELMRIYFIASSF